VTETINAEVRVSYMLGMAFMLQSLELTETEGRSLLALVASRIRSNTSKDPYVWTDEDRKALNTLRSLFYDYPCDEDDERLNEEISRAQLTKLVDAVLGLLADLKSRK